MATPETIHSSGDVTVLCKNHRRRCMLHQVPGFPARVAHISRAGTAAEYCDAVLFQIRHEYDTSREFAVAALEANADIKAWGSP